jgi:hypothetical protein
MAASEPQRFETMEDAILQAKLPLYSNFRTDQAVFGGMNIKDATKWVRGEGGAVEALGPEESSRQ